MSSRTRRAVERCIEALIDLLDAIDGDPDLEVEEDEPEQDSEAEGTFYAD
jgi:hypothetical protein